MKRSIAFFDFDGTITTKDTFLEFVRFVKGSRKFWIGFLINSPLILAMKLKLISNQAAKEKVLAYFFKGTSIDQFENWCQQFNQQILPSLIRPGAITEINRLKMQGTIVVVVSASLENWIRPWTNQLGIQLIGSRPQITNRVMNGKLIGKNCYGEEKVIRIKEYYNVDEFDEVYAYGDTKGDLPMLEIAKSRFYKPFRSFADQSVS